MGYTNTRKPIVVVGEADTKNCIPTMISSDRIHTLVTGASNGSNLSNLITIKPTPEHNPADMIKLAFVHLTAATTMKE